jgi:glucosylceramidase
MRRGTLIRHQLYHADRLRSTALVVAAALLYCTCRACADAAVFLTGDVPAVDIATSRTATLIQTLEKGDRLKEYTVNVTTSLQPGRQTLRVNPAARRQTLLGFGGAFTDSVAHVFAQLSADLQEQVLEAMWGASGQRYNLARLTIGSTDFSVNVYNYDDLRAEPAGSVDFNQSRFSIEHDEAVIIPLVQRAMRKNPTLMFLSSPWSPPGWMKAGWLTKRGYMRNSAKPGMLQDPRIFASYALYLSKYVAAYKAAGINVSMMTIQNEPDSADHQFPVSYPCCNFNGTEEGVFLKDYLGPQMRRDHPDLRIFVHDGQKFHDVPILTRVQAIIAAAGGLSPNAGGSSSSGFIDGVAFHWYGNNLKNYQYLAELHDKYPALPLLATEATLEAPASQHLGSSPWKEAQKYGVDIIGDLNQHTTGWIEWNVLLDSTGGPTCIGPTATEECTPLAGHCDAPILADTAKQKLEFRDSYYIMAHFSRFIPRGAVVVDANVENATKVSGEASPPLLLTAAVVESSNSLELEVVAVVLNTADTHTPYQLAIGESLVVLVDSMTGRGVHTIRLRIPK